MVLTPMLWLELGVATLIAVGIIWTRAEYGLFLYALALGFPDIALPLGATINIRVDDFLILIFLARTFLWTPAAPTQGQKNIYIWQSIFLAVCLLVHRRRNRAGKATRSL